MVLPQAWRTILPPVGNEFIALLKDTSLVSILGVADLLRRGREFASESFEYFETFTMADRKLYEAKMAGRNRVLAATVL